MRFSTVTFVALAALLATSTARDVKSFERRMLKRGVPSLPTTSNSYDGSSYGGEGTNSGSGTGDYDGSGSGGSSGSGTKHPTSYDDYDNGSGSGGSSGTGDYDGSGSGSGSGTNDYDGGSGGSSGTNDYDGSGSDSGSGGSSGSWSGDADCEYDSDGYLTGVRKSGCPYQITIKGKGDTKCKFNNKGQLITVDALNCSNICILSKTCPKQQSCDIQNSGTIVISALSCSNISVLSGLLRK